MAFSSMTLRFTVRGGILALWLISSTATASKILPKPDEVFTGKLEPTEQASTPMYPSVVAAPEHAPNILLVMTDDVGFASSSTFGGSVPTPHLDQLAREGLRYNRFHTTAVCSPTRAALLTGRNHHTVGMGSLVEMRSPYPGYTGVLPHSAATIARILQGNGYNTAMFGKDHNVLTDERSAAGPFHNWPTGRGFEYFFGFFGGDTSQWQPALYEGITPVDTSTRKSDYLLDEELADRTINWIHNQKAAAPDKPFFIYFAPGTAHAPHQAPAEWIDKFKGKYDHGWDRERELIFARQRAMGIIPADANLAPKPDFIPDWNSLTAKQQQVYARFMEVFAAQLAFQDAQLGRVFDELKRMGQADNTLVVFIEGDNGASADGYLTGTINEIADLTSQAIDHDIDVDWLADHLDVLGGPRSYQTYSAGWAVALNSPFPWYKQLASHLGGTRNGLVISWPKGIKARHEIRNQYHHVIDIVPTLLDASGIEPPMSVDGVEQLPFDGTSMRYSFDNRKAESTRVTQYYEINGNRGIYHEGWLASTVPRIQPWAITSMSGDGNVMGYEWELYDLRSDFSQSRNLAQENPQKLAEMMQVFDREARKYNVYPIQDSSARSRRQKMMGMSGASFRTQYRYWGKDIQLTMEASPPIFFLPYSISAEVVVPDSGGDGVLVAAGSYFGGWSFYLDQGKPVALNAVSPVQNREYLVSSREVLSPGEHTIKFSFTPALQGGGNMSIYVDGKAVAQGHLKERPGVMAASGETFDIGRDTRTPVTTRYQKEGVFDGVIKKVEVEVFMP